MEWSRLFAPFDPQTLWDVAARSWERNWRDLSYMIAPLAAFADEGELSDFIRQRWRREGTTLRNWAADLLTVSVWVSAYDISLRVSGRGIPHSAVEIDLPPSDDVLDPRALYVLDLLPNNARTLLRGSPGLSIGDSGRLIDVSAVLHPLHCVHHWVQDDWWAENQIANSECLVEFAWTGLGDAYLLDRQQRLLFFDHETTRLFDCNVSTERFLDDWLANPSTIINPFSAGWATDDDTDQSSVPPDVKDRSADGLPALAQLYEKLSLRRRVALGLRHWQRGAERARAEGLPACLVSHLERLEVVCRGCITSCCGIAILAQETLHDYAAVCTDVLENSDVEDPADDVDLHARVLALKLRDIVLSMGALNEPDARIHERLYSVRNVMPMRMFKQVNEAELEDVRALLAIEECLDSIAKRDALKRFFARPLWRFS